MRDPRAPAAVRAMRDATERWPNRRKSSDGIMGDVRHQATKSDHNVGNAFDISHDPEHGPHGDLIAGGALLDPRTLYVIWRRRINSNDGRGWRKYNGSNPHTQHVHVSIRGYERELDGPWPWSDPSRDDDAIHAADGELVGMKRQTATKSP